MHLGLENTSHSCSLILSYESKVALKQYASRGFLYRVAHLPDRLGNRNCDFWKQKKAIVISLALQLAN